MIDIYMDMVAADLDIIRYGIPAATVGINLPWQGMRMARCRNLSVPGFMAWNAINDFVDIGSRTSNLLDAEFISFLHRMRSIFPMDEGMAGERDIINNLRRNTVGLDPNIAFWDGSPRSMESFGNHVFVVSNEFLAPIGAIVPFTAPAQFEGFIPLVDRQGRRKSNMGVTYPWKMVSIPRGDNDLLAWEFVTQHLIPASLCYRTNRARFWAIPNYVHTYTNLGARTFDSPIIRDLTEPHFVNVFERTMTRRWLTVDVIPENEGFVLRNSRAVDGLPLAGIHDATPAEQELTIADAIRRIDEINNSLISPVPLIPFELFEHIIHQMLRHVITPEGAAQGIHEAVSQWLDAA